MAEFTNVRFVLAVRDLAQSTHYYTSVLGLSVDFHALGWSFLSRGTFRVMLGECTDPAPPTDLGDHSWSGHLIVSDAAALFPEYTEAGAEFTQHLADKPWGMREFGVRTIDGHRLMFGQEAFKPNPPIGFVQRLRSCGVLGSQSARCGPA